MTMKKKQECVEKRLHYLKVIIPYVIQMTQVITVVVIRVTAERENSIVVVMVASIMVKILIYY